MKTLRYVLVFVGFLVLEAVLCVLLPRIRDSGVSMPACMWIAFYGPLVLVFIVFSMLAFKDWPRRGLPRLIGAAAGGFLASLLWAGIVFFVGVKVTGAGTLMNIQGNAQLQHGADGSQPFRPVADRCSVAAGFRGSC